MDFNQFIGFLVFLTVFTLGFWMMIFLLVFVIPYWIIGYLKEEWTLKRQAKKEKA